MKAKFEATTKSKELTDVTFLLHLSCSLFNQLDVVNLSQGI